MRNSLLVALGIAASVALSASAGFAATVYSIAGGSLGSAPAEQFIDAGDTLIMTGSIDGTDGTVDFAFTANEDLVMNGININYNGDDGDVRLIDVTIDNGASRSTILYIPAGPASTFAFVTFDEFSVAAGEKVTVTFTDTSGSPSLMTGAVPIAFSATTSIPVSAPVPLPAGLPLLLTAAGGLAVLRARRAA